MERAGGSATSAPTPHFSPDFSVVVPARDCAEVLVRSLSALRASDVSSRVWELIVVDDGSSDSTADVAADFADVVLRLEGGPRGPAFARNRGVERARGKCVVFVDADVCVHTDALGRLMGALDSGSGPAAVFGAYDVSPPEQGLISQYRNLLHYYVHWTNAGPAETFWAGLGAVQRDVFVNVGMFDEERFPKPQIEDIELGYRLTSRGHRIALSPDVQGTHLKRWTLSRMVRTDFSDRAVPWMRLLLERRSAARAATLNIKQSEKALTLISGAAVLFAGVACVTGHWGYALLSLACFAVVVLANLPLLAWFARERGLPFAVAVIPLRLLFYLVSGAGAAWAMLLHVLASRRSTISLRGATS